METKTLTLGVGSLIRILGPALSFVSASEAADQNCPARQHLPATQHVGDREDLRPSIIQPNENANGLQESLEPFYLQHFKALERQNHDLMEIATLLSTTLKKTQQQLSFIKQQNKKLKIAAIKTEQEKQSLKIQLQQQTQARKAAEERSAELLNALTSTDRDFDSCRSCIHNGVVILQCMLEDVENYYSGENEQSEALAEMVRGCQQVLSCLEPIDDVMSQL